MDEYLTDAKQELKRVDHLVFVSLKYTRTVDVIRSVVLRMIDAMDHIDIGILEFEKSKKKIKSYPSSQGQRLEYLKELYKDNQEIFEYLLFHTMLRKIMRLPFTKREEYRRHVTMTVNLNGKEIDVHIDQLRIYYDKIKDFLKVVSILIYGKND